MQRINRGDLKPLEQLREGEPVYRAMPDLVAPNGVCNLCHGVGYVVMWKKGETEQELLPCTCMQPLLAQRVYQDALRLSDLGKVADKTFANFKVIPGSEAALERARRFAARAIEGTRPGWLLLQGRPGSGKTHLAAAIGNEVARTGRPVMLLVVPDLLDHLRHAYAPDSPVSFDDRFQQIRTIPTLILDDMGTETVTPWAREKLYQLLNHRYNVALPTVITTNCAMKSFEADEPRLASRMQDVRLVTAVRLECDDYRRTR